jgi:peptidyl-prolyl cis-trans isomerase SurA
MSTLIGTTAMAQTAPGTQAAGRLNPAAANAPQRATPVAQFALADGIIATVNDRIITGFDLRQRMLLVIALSEVQPTEENLPAIQQEALNALVDERLQAQELAEYKDLVIPDEEVNAEIAAMAQEAGTTAETYVAFLEQGGIRASTLRDYLRISIGWRELVGGRFGNRSRVSRAQVEQAMRQEGETASKKRYRVGEIYIEAARVGGMQQAVNGAQQLVQQMMGGAPFQSVARQFSAAPSAVRGGDSGWLVEGSMLPTLQQAFDNLQVGQLSNPIIVEGGVYIIYMIDKQEGAGTSMVQLKQVMIEAADTVSPEQVAEATSRLEGLRPQLTCDTILPRATSESGLLGADLGESDVANLFPAFQNFAQTARVGEISTPVRSPLGVHVLALCGRRVGGAEAPAYRDIENRLQRTNLSMLGRRYMRDLRNDALIEFK